MAVRDLLTALAIKLSGLGPVIIRQRQTGFDGRVFWIYKFRTMSALKYGTQTAQTRRSDLIVTKTGTVLRQSSIDELPKLINVIKGEMSLVGPSPHAVAHDEQGRASISSYAFRHHVKPGITGWAQINGQRVEAPMARDMEKRIALDLWYIDNWSLMLDFKNTVAVLLRGNPLQRPLVPAVTLQFILQCPAGLPIEATDRQRGKIA
jgi:lipopolysaccharide/colanic/teichoic acid biosynthesis glycosyltransferase